MLNGVWNLYIQAGANSLRTSITINDNVITGEDSAYTYTGKIHSADNGRIAADIRIQRRVPGEGPSINKLDDYTLEVTGSISGSTISGEGGIKGAQSKPYKIKGQKSA